MHSDVMITTDEMSRGLLALTLVPPSQFPQAGPKRILCGRCEFAINTESDKELDQCCPRINFSRPDPPLHPAETGKIFTRPYTRPD